MQYQKKVKVIGVGPKGECIDLDSINNAEILLGGKRLLDFFKNVKAEKIVVAKNIKEKLLNLKEKEENSIVILASGDPFFFGIGRLVVEIFGKDNVEIIPYLNSVQLLCSKAKINYEDFVNVSIHGREISEKVIGKIKRNKKIAILTDKENNINKIAEILINYIDENSKVILGQMLGTDKESVIETTLKKLLELKPSDLDTLLIFNERLEEIRFGLGDDSYIHEKGLITKKEVRAVTLSFLELNIDSVLWDIGAGSGSISIEASKFCSEGKIFAIEKDLKRVEIIKENVKKFKSHNIKVIHGEVPQILDKLELADRVFIGGAQDIENLLNYIIERVNGIIVANFVTVEKLYKFLNFCMRKNLKFEISSIQIGNLKPIANNHYFKSQNTVYICKFINFLKN